MGIAISAGVDLAAALGKLSDSADRLSRAAELVGKLGNPNPTHSPLVRKFAAAKVAANFTYNFIDLGGPIKGRIWDLRRLWIGGPDPFTAVTGNAFIFVSAGVGLYPDSSTEPTNFPEIIGVNGTTTLPYRDVWARGTATLLPGERLMVGLKSVPNTTVLWCYGQALEWWESDMESWASP